MILKVYFHVSFFMCTHYSVLFSKFIFMLIFHVYPLFRSVFQIYFHVSFFMYTHLSVLFPSYPLPVFMFYEIRCHLPANNKLLGSSLCLQESISKPHFENFSAGQLPPMSPLPAKYGLADIDTDKELRRRKYP